MVPELLALALPAPSVSATTPPALLPLLIAVALPLPCVRASRKLKFPALASPIVPELLAMASPLTSVSATTSLKAWPMPVSFPVLVTVALPPPAPVCAKMPFAILLPELVAVATPPPVVCDANPLAVPELVVVAFWFVPVAVLVKSVGALPELVQVSGSLVGGVHINCAEAGELANIARKNRTPAHCLRIRSPLRLQREAQSAYYWQ